MQELISSIKHVLKEKDLLPFSIYSSIKKQRILNVPILKPLMICILDGQKKLGQSDDIICPAGSFVFLSNGPNIDVRNIPTDSEYFALLIEFDYEDFDCLVHKSVHKQRYVQGQIDPLLEETLKQFVEWSAFAPPEIWSARRQEILKLMCYLGYEQLSAIAEPPTLGHQVSRIISANISDDLSMSALSSQLAMSESSLRRKLNREGVSIKSIKDRTRLGYGLHLIQTSYESVGLIAEKCGYHSQSRFTEKFKQLFGITPTELRKTRLHD